MSAAVLAAPPAASAATDSTPPTVPQQLRVTGTTADSVSLAWSASTDRSGTVSYRVYVDGAQRTSAAGAAHTQSGLAGDRRYTFAVRAVDRYGNVSASSNTVEGTTTGAPSQLPQAPGNLRIDGTWYDSVSLAWNAAGGDVAYYQILRNGVWVDSAYGTAATLRYLAAGTTYRIEVRTRDSRGNLSPAAAIEAATRLDTGPPTVPSNLRVVTGPTGRPTGLSWDASTDDRGISGYWLFADGDTAFDGGQGVDFLSLTDVFCTVFRGETYTFTVRARDLSGNLSAAGTPLRITVP